jgi:hypothetical protein
MSCEECMDLFIEGLKANIKLTEENTNRSVADIS